MQKLLWAATLASLVSLSIGQAAALDIHKMGQSDINEWIAMPANELRATLSGKTIHINVTSRAVGTFKPVLGTGSLILYAAPGGALLWWTAKHETIQSGAWTTETLTEGWELPCFKFDAPGGRTDCYFGGAANYEEWTSGNPFQLRAGAVPAVEMTSRSTIRELARKAGL
jgi:hypothetical protein